MRYDWNLGAIYVARLKRLRVGAIITYLTPPAGTETAAIKWQVNLKLEFAFDLVCFLLDFCFFCLFCFDCFVLFGIGLRVFTAVYYQRLLTKITWIALHSHWKVQ